MLIRRYYLVAVIFACVVSLLAGTELIKGCDISSLSEIEAHLGKYYAGEKQEDLFDCMQKYGVNFVRLRLWNANENGEASLTKLQSLALRAKAHNMKILLDFHYSDTWADPAHQTKPAAWTGYSPKELNKVIEQYSFDVVNALIQIGAYPDIVQPGNEITNGLLWDTGRVNSKEADHWEQFGRLLNSAITGIRRADKNHSIKIMLHHSNGYEYQTVRWFYAKLQNYVTDYDIIGVSYYPFFHGTDLAVLRNTLNRLGREFDKPVLIAETASPWSTGWSDATGNVFGEKSPYNVKYPPTPDGQKEYLAALFALVAALDDQRGLGVVYWEPGWIPADGYGSSWENLALFDFKGRALPAWESFTKTGTAK